MEMTLAIKLLRSFFGWTLRSKMPSHYARSMFEDRLKTVWRGRLDDRAEFLRQLRQLQQCAGLQSEIEARPLLRGKHNVCQAAAQQPLSLS